MPKAPKTAWKPGDPLPPWNGENDAMRDWMFHQLENFYRAQRDELLKDPIDPEAGDVTILELLDSGDDSEHKHGLALLNQLASRLLGPEIADRIQWKRKQGRPKGKPRYTLPPTELPERKAQEVPAIHVVYGYFAKVHMAKKAVPIIQNIWREHYEGKWQRSRGDIDAYKIAAEYFCVGEEAVRAKPSGRHKPRAKDKRP
jgi:hypothetical protein